MKYKYLLWILAMNFILQSPLFSNEKVQNYLRLDTVICPELKITFSTKHERCFDDCQAVVGIKVDSAFGSVSYLWSNGSKNKNQFGLCAGVYYVNVVDQNNCTGSDTITILQPDEMIVTIDSFEHITLDHLGSISATIVQNNTDMRYGWRGPNGFLSDSVDLDDLVESGCYVFIGSDSNNCIVRREVCLEDLTFSEELYREGIIIVVYPNPSSDYVYIDLDGKEPSNVNIKVYDMDGSLKEVKCKMSSQGKMILDLRNFLPGQYVLYVLFENENPIHKSLIIK